MLKKILIGVVGALVVTAGVYANRGRTPKAIEVQTENVKRRDLTATVSGSGKIRPFKEVDISSNVSGRVVQLSVLEGQEVSTGQFLLRIDPVRYRSAVEQVEASIQSAETNAELARQNLAYANDVLDRREGLYQQDLLAEEAYLDALQSVRREEQNLQMRETDVERLRAQLKQSEHDLSQVAFQSPIDGVITKLSIEEGETAITGTMNNPGTVLLTIADLSFVEAEIEIDETDIVDVELGQEAEVRIDAFPDDVFAARVIEVGRSPISGAQATSSTQAINFKVVVRVLEAVPGARPGLSCTADVVTATRSQALSVPIQSLILREVELDEDGKVVQRDPIAELLAEVDAGSTDSDDEEEELQELEGAFLVRDGKAEFVPVSIGVAGERYFEVLDGVGEGDEVVVGPFDVIRTLQTGESVDPGSTSRNRSAEETE